ncbi:hypothetical protein MUK42_28007 [Musa troglodytarum]|uniref:Transmembrane protein n=1 Tax=Musa troglodytarum TaxID=320322 RepID=A0A9E7L3L8_9LILI|nr:hypothetical protein MUK42_28007 [Musa troglodytarum]
MVSLLDQYRLVPCRYYLRGMGVGRKVIDAVLGLALVKSCLSSNPRVQRLLSFGSPNEPSEALPVSAPQPPVMGTAGNSSVTALQMDSGLPVGADEKRESRSVAELAVPAALCVGIYGSIPADVQLNHHNLALYDPLLAFICLGVFASLSIVIYALVNSAGGSEVESTKQKVMGAAVGFLMMAFLLRILLLFPLTSLGLFGLVFFLGAAVVALVFFLSWKKESRKLASTAPDPGGSGAVDNPV